MKKIQEIESDFKKIKKSPQLREVTEGSAQLIMKFLDLPLNAAKGISWLTVKDWQISNHILFENFNKMSKTERDNAVKEMFEIYRQRLTKLLVHPEEQKSLIDEAIDKIWNIWYVEYQKKFDQNIR